MEYIYGFTNDNKKVVIGTVEETLEGHDITILPYEYSRYDSVTITTLYGDGTTTVSSQDVNFKSGAVLNNVVSVTAVPRVDIPYYTNIAFVVTADKDFLYSYVLDGNTITGSGNSIEFSDGGPTTVTITFTQDTTCSIYGFIGF